MCDVSSSAKTQLFVSSVDQLLKSRVYAAKEVGYSYSLSPSPDGLTLSFSGLSDPVTFGKFINLVTGGEFLPAHLSASQHAWLCAWDILPLSCTCTHAYMHSC